MTGEATQNGGDSVTVCRSCGAKLYDEHVETTEDGEQQRFECPECEEVYFRETFFGKQARYDDDDKDAFGFTQSDVEETAPRGTVDEGPRVTPEVDTSGISVECSWDGCDCSPNDLEDGEMRRTVEDGLLCPEHFTLATEEHGHKAKYKRE